MSVHALHITLNQPVSADDHQNITIAASILVGRDDGPQFADVLHAQISLLTNGVFKTPAEMNASVVDAVKASLLQTFAIPVDGYAAVYLSGGYGSPT